MGTPESPEGLVVRRSRGDRPVTAAVVALTSVAGLLDAAAADIPGSWRIVATAVFSVGLLLAVVVVVDVARSGSRSTPLLSIGPAGVTVPDADTVLWSDIASMRITRGGRSDAIRAVAFIPRPGRQMPAVRASGLRKGPVGRSPGAVAARYGSALVVLPDLMTATATQTVDAARRWGTFDPPGTGSPDTRDIDALIDRGPR